MRVLVACIIQRLYSWTAEAIFAQDWQGSFDVLFIEQPDDPNKTPYERVTEKYNYVRDRFLSGPYDALFVVENDMIVPRNALRTLDDVGADVAYGLYCWRHNPFFGVWSAYPLVREDQGLSLCQRADEAKRLWGQRVQVNGLGLGCTLIRRPVLEALPFRYSGTFASCDWTLALDCQEHGFTQCADLSVVCGHILPDTPRKVLWPDITQPFLYRVDTL